VRMNAIEPSFMRSDSSTGNKNEPKLALETEGEV